MPRNRRWSREELVIALDLYFKIGASYKTHPDVIDLSERLNLLSDTSLEADSNRFNLLWRRMSGLHKNSRPRLISPAILELD